MKNVVVNNANKGSKEEEKEVNTKSRISTAKSTTSSSTS